MISEAEDQAALATAMTYEALKEYFAGSKVSHDNLMAATKKLGETVGEMEAVRVARNVLFLEHLMLLGAVASRAHPAGALIQDMIIDEAMALSRAGGIKRVDLHTLLVAAKSDSQEQDVKRATDLILPPGLRKN